MGRAREGQAEEEAQGEAVRRPVQRNTMLPNGSMVTTVKWVEEEEGNMPTRTKWMADRPLPMSVRKRTVMVRATRVGIELWPKGRRYRELVTWSTLVERAFGGEEVDTP
jgi:hypothetical protein